MVEYILLLVAGFAAGAINAVAGGGILIVFPALIAAGLSPLTANITSNLIVWPAALASAHEYRKDLSKTSRSYYLLLVPCFAGAGLGIFLLQHTSSALFDKIVPWLVLSAVLLFIFQPQLHKHIHRPARLRKASPLAFVGIGLFFAAIYGGYFGAGFGFIMLALLGFTKLKNVYQIVGLKNLASGGMAIIASLYFAITGGIAWEYGLIAVTGAIIGGHVGARWAHHISPHLVRAVIVAIGLVLVTITFARSTEALSLIHRLI